MEKTLNNKTEVAEEMVAEQKEKAEEGAATALEAGAAEGAAGAAEGVGTAGAVTDEQKPEEPRGGVGDGTEQAATDEAGAAEKSGGGKKKSPVGRTFFFASQLKHPETGAEILNELTVKKALEEHKNVKAWAYILHDKDTYTEADEAKDTTGRIKVGAAKAPHFHVLFRTAAPISIRSVANWFGVAENFINIPKGRNAFWQCLQYMTHDGHADKHQYSDEEMNANFDWRQELDTWKVSQYRQKCKREKRDTRDYYRNKVLMEGMTIRQVVNENKYAYIDDWRTLDSFRMKFITEKAKMPALRLTYYIWGEGGVGKTAMARSLARSLYPGAENEDDIYFMMGDAGAGMLGYDGQPVVIIDDMRPGDLIRTFGNIGNVYKLLDSHPSRSRMNVKYGAVNITAPFIIITGPYDYKKFITGLAGEYTDSFGRQHEAENEAQAWRRFPIILSVRTSDFDLLINKGFIGGGAWDDYEENKNIIGNLRRLNELCGQNKTLLHELEKKVTAPAIAATKQIESYGKERQLSDDEIRREFADAGKQRKQRPENADDRRWAAESVMSIFGEEVK